MVQRDYVRKKSQSKKNKSRNMPNLMILLAIIIIILFSAILYFVSNNKPAQITEQPKAKTQPPAVTLPEQPQERWTYLKELETPNASSNAQTNSVANTQNTNNTNNANTQIATTSAPSQTSQIVNTSNKWSLQCGAFKDKANADTLRAKLAMTGISGNISSGQLYRVTVGPFTNKNEADRTMSSLLSNGINNCVVSNK